ncbi:recombinase family protein, partial [Flavonifractor plautii]|uniref:recombinase family protein n=1 Tax=Flavonifractor plautii TaxID=292800 RepID=UPI00210DADFC
AAIEAGYISAVFVKDLSRLGRNYIVVGKLTEEFFPLHDVRLVAVSDGVDSDEGEDDFTPFKNIMNEYYAKDISKKRRIVNKMKGNAGIPLSPPPYGYIKNPDDTISAESGGSFGQPVPLQRHAVDTAHHIGGHG